MDGHGVEEADPSNDSSESESTTRSRASSSGSDSSDDCCLEETKLALIAGPPKSPADLGEEDLVSLAPVKFMKGEIDYRQFVSLVSKTLPETGDDDGSYSRDYSAGSEEVGIDGVVSDDEEFDLLDDEDHLFDAGVSASAESSRIRRDELEHASHYELESEECRGMKGSSKRLRKSKLDPTLRGLLGEANLRYARGQRRSAIDVCLQVVTKCPYAPEPYQTLGLIYEDEGQREKSLQFQLIAAHLKKTDAEEWILLGELAEELGRVEQAASCYGNAYAADKNNFQLGVLYASMLGDRMSKKTKFNFYKSLWARRKQDAGIQHDPKALLHFSKELARLGRELGDLATAASVMTDAFVSCANDVVQEDLNFLLELMVAQERFEAVVWVLTTYYGARLDVAPEEDVLALTAEDVLIRRVPVRFKELLSRSKAIVVPDVYSFDIRAKLAVSLIRLEIYWLAETVVDPFMKAGPKGIDDLMWNVAAAYMVKKKFDRASVLLQALANEPRYATSERLMSFAECQSEVGENVRAVLAYKKILEKWPNHVDARLSLCRVLRLLGSTDEALDFIAQDETDRIDVHLLRVRCRILLEEGRTDDLIPVAFIFFSRHFAQLRSPEDVQCSNLTASFQRLQGLVGTNKYTFTGTQVTPEEEWDLFRAICARFYRDRKFVELHRLCLSALGSTIFRPKDEMSLSAVSFSRISRSSDLVFYALQSCLLVANYEVAYVLIRGMLIGNWANTRVFHLLSNFFNMSPPIADRHGRFLSRFLVKLRERGLPCEQPVLVNANLSLLSGGNFKLAVVDEYISVYRKNLEDPLLPLLIGICYVHLTSQKFANFKNGFLIQGCTFLKTYCSLRGECQETQYNLGRAYHQLGLTGMALHHYDKALALRPVLSSDLPGSAWADLTAEIAFNMHLIYKSSGNFHLARGLLIKFCRV